MDVIMISSGSRPDLLAQSLSTLVLNSTQNHNIVLVADGWLPSSSPHVLDGSTVISTPQGGASRARNIGASSIPKYRRSNIVTFLDDDVYLCPEWDKHVTDLLVLHGGIVSGHAHPFNQALYSTRYYDQAQVLSTVHMSMPWHIWDTVGFFTEPGGKGGSEDVDFCKRAIGYSMEVTAPQCVIHCGIKDIVGKKEMEAQNEYLIKQWNLKGVKFS